jgi:hypothetical protein
MAGEALAALITAGSALALAVFGLFTARMQDRRLLQLEREKAGLERTAAIDKARLDYEYEARKRLYGKFDPLMFQLLEHAGAAVINIANLARPETWDRLSRPGEQDVPLEAGRPPMAPPKYEMVSTTYALYAPLVLVRLMRRALTLFDLGLDPVVELQYHLASCLYRIPTEDTAIAREHPSIDYDPFASGWRELRKIEPAKYWWQGLTSGRLDSFLDLMTVGHGGDRMDLMSFGEFEALYDKIYHSGEERDRKSLATATNSIYGFTPQARPVLCRMLMGQAGLYQALVRTRSSTIPTPRDPAGWRALVEIENLDRFRLPGRELDAPMGVELSAVHAYLVKLLA